MEGYVTHYNNVRLNSVIGYITPKDMLAGRHQEIHAERDRKLEDARKQRQVPSPASCVKKEEASLRATQSGGEMANFRVANDPGTIRKHDQPFLSFR